VAVIGEAIAGLRLARDWLRGRDERRKSEDARLATPLNGPYDVF
jgi:hypothetical protein